jgi:hypothetical protein
MSLPININELLRGKSFEWERLEFKEGWNSLGTLHTICAFANDFHNLGGGYIVVGVGEKNGQPVLPPKGLDPGSIDAIQKEILNLGHSATPQVTPQVSRLLEVLIDDMSRAEIMSALALKDRMHFANDYLRPALEEDLIQYTIPDKPNSRLQQYRLTEKGRAVVGGPLKS